jgi:hypothetical protein
MHPTLKSVQVSLREHPFNRISGLEKDAEEANHNHGQDVSTRSNQKMSISRNDYLDIKVVCALEALLTLYPFLIIHP